MLFDQPLSFKNVAHTDSVDWKFGAVRARQDTTIMTKLPIDTKTAGAKYQAFLMRYPLPYEEELTG